MRRAVGLGPEARKRSSRQMHPRDPHHPKAAGSRWPTPPTSPERGGFRTPPAPARHVVFEDEVATLGRPPKRVPYKEEVKKPGARSVPPGLTPQPRAVPDYVVKYPAIRSHRQREGYKGVFQDQLAEYEELLGEIRAARRGLGEPEVAVGQQPRHATSRTMGGSGVAHIEREYVRKKRDWAFLEKQRRCEYLKKKLTHIKARIREYDRDARDSAVYF